MEQIQVNTIKKLSQSLKKFDKQLPVAIFDPNYGYMSVAFKKEQKEENGKMFQWLTFYAHETIQMYTIEQLQTYLSKLPPQATISIQDENGHYTDLFLSIDGMKDKDKFLQWLVISNELEYDRFFRPQEVKQESSYLEQALEKMLQEVKKETSNQIEHIHQYLCKQSDDTLFKGIMTEGKSIKGALSYCSKKAQEQSENGWSAMIDDNTVYEWIKDYFIHYELPKKVEKKKTTPKKKENKVKKEPINTVTNKVNKPKNTEKVGNEQQIELFALA